MKRFIVAAVSLPLLIGCAAERHHNRDLELVTVTPGQLPPPGVWVGENDLATTPTTTKIRASARATSDGPIGETSLAPVTGVSLPPSPSSETTVIRVYPQNDPAPTANAYTLQPQAAATANAYPPNTNPQTMPPASSIPGAVPANTRVTARAYGDNATATASVPTPQTNIADAFSADSAAFGVDRGNTGTMAPTEDVFRSNAGPVQTPPPTGPAVRAAAAAGARAFENTDTPSSTAPATQPLAVAYEKRGIVLKLDDSLFAPDSATLTWAGNKRLDEVAAFLMNYPGRAVIVESHTDSTGTAPNNQQLSQNRAEAIRAALLARGVAPGNLSARGYGENYPVASNISETGRAANRRVEIVLLPPGQAGPQYREMFEASAGDLMNNEVGEAPGTNALDLGGDRIN